MEEMSREQKAMVNHEMDQHRVDAMKAIDECDAYVIIGSTRDGTSMRVVGAIGGLSTTELLSFAAIISKVGRDFTDDAFNDSPGTKKSARFKGEGGKPFSNERPDAS